MACLLNTRDKFTFYKAVEHCKDSNTRLPVILGSQEQNEIKKRKDQDNLSVIWLGAEDSAKEGVFTWMVENRPKIDDNFINWSQGQPDDWSTGEDCLEMIRDGTWNDQDCTSVPRHFMCEKVLD